MTASNQCGIDSLPKNLKAWYKYIMLLLKKFNRRYYMGLKKLYANKFNHRRNEKPFIMP